MPVRLDDDEVADEVRVEAHLAADHVFELHLAARDLETNRELGAVFGRIRTEAAPRVLVGPFHRLRQLALRFGLLAGAVAAIRHPPRTQPRTVRLEGVGALRLAVS